jgi:hypothetical protein
MRGEGKGNAIGGADMKGGAGRKGPVATLVGDTYRHTGRKGKCNHNETARPESQTCTDAAMNVHKREAACVLLPHIPDSW